MTTPFPLRVADAAATDQLDPVNLEALVKRTVQVFSPSESLSDFTQASGEIALCVAMGDLGQLFFYDSADTTTADDGLTCLVDGSGHRYKLEDSATVAVSSVISETNTPAVGPTIGDAYIVGTVPTGAWSANAKDIAVYTRRGWVFLDPAVGTTVLNKATDTNYQYTDAGTWGAFVAQIDAGSLVPSKLAFPMGLHVEETTNTPPGSPAADLYYIVGSAPTGAWSAQAGKVATYEDAAWVFLTPYDGARVYDRSQNFDLIYDTGVWSGAVTSQIQEFTTTGAATWTKPTFGTTAIIECWGAGGSGGRGGNTDGGGGGGGGSYARRFMKLSDLASTVSVTVGAGGVSRTSNDTNGAAGGNTTFGTHLTGYGGGGGGGNVTSSGGGGGGGGTGSVGSQGVGGGGDTDGGAGGTTSIGETGGTAGSGAVGGAGSIAGGGGGGGGGGPTGGFAGGSAYDGGGGGGGGAGGAGSGAAGGNSISGGAGGGGGGDGSGASGGTSSRGGNGGAGTTGSTAAADGSQPGGGGGGSEQGNSGKGGDGMCRVTVF